MVPTTFDDILAMIRDQVQESLHLDYKDSRAVQSAGRDEIAKDVSAFANSDGGVIVYGIREQDHLPVGADDGVVDPACSREWLEAVLLSRISPRIEGIRIHPIPRPNGRYLYVVEVPKSFRGPHQASDQRYYKRHNFKSVPMEDYEIADLRLRRRHLPPLVAFEVLDYRQFLVVFDITNIGDLVAQEVRFEFEPQIPWPSNRGIPGALRNGIHRLPPRQRLRFGYFTFSEILAEGSQVPRQFGVRISYFHPEAGCRVAEESHVDFEAYRDSMSVRSGTEEQLRDLLEVFKKMTEQIERLRKAIESFQPLTAPTGLNLSISTLRNLQRLARNDNRFEPIDPIDCTPDVYREVLGVDIQTALELYQALSRGGSKESLEGRAFITNELMLDLERCFRLR